MAIWYWDPVGGNNANDGTTFANRKLNLQNLTLVAAGDTVRCIKSPDAVNTGINATWTDGSNTVTLASAQTLLVSSCDTNWTASTNVTCTATATGRKEGTFCQQTAVAAGFTTGKASYFATGTLNCSGYQQLTFWITQTAGTLAVAGDYTMSLCSDVAGATQVNNFAIPAVGALNQPFPVTIDLGTNLGASIQSIAFYVNVDRGAVTFNFDNINVALASASASALTVSSLIGKGGTDNQYLGIRSISGTTVILDSAPQYTLNLAGTEPLWSGTTETVALYRRETLKTIQGTAAATYVNYYAGATGTLGSTVTISGGWDTTNMSTQTGQTYLDGSNGLGYGLSTSNSTVLFSFLTISNINCYRFNSGIFTYSSNGSGVTNLSIITDNLNNNNMYGLNSNLGIANLVLSINNTSKNGSTAGSAHGVYLQAGTPKAVVSILNANSNWGHGLYVYNNGTGSVYNSTITLTNACRNMYSGLYTNAGLVACTVNITNLSYNTPSQNYGQLHLEGQQAYTIPIPYSTIGQIAGVHDNVFNIVNITSNGNAGQVGIIFGLASNNNKVNMSGAFFGFAGTYPCIISAGIANYFTSTNTVFGSTAGFMWVNAGVGSKIYINTADVLLPNMAYSPDSSIIFKNYYGVPGQTAIFPANWGLT